MGRAFAVVIDRRSVRIALVVVGSIVTVALGPLAAAGAYGSLVSLFQGQMTSEFIADGLAGLGGIVGLVGAWCRVILPTSRFRGSPILLALTSASIAIGVLAAAIVFFVHSAGPANPAAWWFVAISALGVVLLLATLGARASAT